MLRRRARKLTAHLPRSVSVLGSVGLLGFVGSCLLFVGVATLDVAIYLALSAASLTLYASALLVGHLADPYALQRAQALRQARSRRIHRNSDRFTRSSGVWRTRVTSP